MQVISSIIANNRLRSETPDGYDVSGAIISNFNLIATLSGAVLTGTNNLTDVKLKLGKLANNGGLTKTMLPSAGSPNENAGTNSDNLTSDQRGQARVKGTAIDIGAVEVS